MRKIVTIQVRIDLSKIWKVFREDETEGLEMLQMVKLPHKADFQTLLTKLFAAKEEEMFKSFFSCSSTIEIPNNCRKKELWIVTLMQPATRSNSEKKYGWSSLRISNGIDTPCYPHPYKKTNLLNSILMSTIIIPMILIMIGTNMHNNSM